MVEVLKMGALLRKLFAEPAVTVMPYSVRFR
jgi:hypothetical protein